MLQINNKCERIRDRILSLMLVLSVVVGMLAGISCNEEEKADAAEEGIVYTIDSNTEITFYPKRGSYGQIEYKKRHFTTGSGIRYYTRYFVISIGEIVETTNLQYMDSDTSFTRLVSSDGKSQTLDEVDKSRDFYWYEDPNPDREGYITTHYVLDGKLFYDLLGKASNNKKQGEIYIHHVFAVTGGSNSDSWHIDNQVTNHKEYWRYSDLMKLWWNNTSATHESQKLCMNVPVPFTRNVRFVTAYYADKDAAPVKASSSIVDFYSDKSMTVANTISPTIEPEITGDDQKIYEVYKSSSMPFEWRWIKVPATEGSPELAYADPMIAAYNNPENMVDGNNIKSKNATDNGVTIPAGTLTSPVHPSFNLGDNISTYTWVVILYVPVREKSATTDLSLHFFDSDTKKEVGSNLVIADNVEQGKKYTISNLDTLLTVTGLSGYEIDTDCELEFTGSGGDDSIKNTYSKAVIGRKGKGTLTENRYITTMLTNDKYTVAWIPVMVKENVIPVYLRYVTNDGSTIDEVGIYTNVLPDGTATITPHASLEKGGKKYHLASPSEYGTRTPKAVYSTLSSNLLSTNYNTLSTLCTITRETNKFNVQAPLKATNALAIKVFIPYVEDEIINEEQTSVVVAYIDSETGNEVDSYDVVSPVRGSIVVPSKTPEGYKIDTKSSIFTPRAIGREGVNKITVDYSGANDSRFTLLSFTDTARCSVKIPSSTADKYAVKIFVPVKKNTANTKIIVKYFSQYGGKYTYLETRMAGAYPFDSASYVPVIETVTLGSKVYRSKSIAGILYGDDESRLNSSILFYSDLLSELGKSNQIMGMIKNYTFNTGALTADFITADEGVCHTVYIVCDEVSSATNTTIHYIDAETGEELQKDIYTSWLDNQKLYWEGVNGNLVWGLGLNLLRTEFEKAGTTYQPVYFCEDSGIVIAKDHTECTKGEIDYYDYSNRRRIYFCKECGNERRDVYLNSFGQEQSGSGNVYDNNDYSHSIHKYTTYSYKVPYTTRFATANIEYIPDVTSYDLSYNNCNMTEVMFYKGSLRLTISDDYEYGVNPFVSWPMKSTGFTNLVIYIPCVKKASKSRVEVKYITLKSNGNKEKEVFITDGGEAEKGKRYTYKGVTEVTDDEGKIYKVIGKREGLSYGDNNYVSGRDDTTNTKGTPVTYNGGGRWTTNNQYNSEEDGILYITVELDEDELDEAPKPMEDIIISYMEPDPTAIVKAQKGTLWDVERAIPTSEFIYSEVDANKYLFFAEFTNKTGYKEYTITIEQPFTKTISYSVYGTDGSLDHNDTYTTGGTATRNVTVRRLYSYWTIDEAAYYRVSKGIISNDVVINDMEAEFGNKITIPLTEFGSSDEYVKWNSTPPTTYSLPEIHLYGNENNVPSDPIISLAEAKEVAENVVPKLKVRNDKMTFDGADVLDSAWKVNDAGAAPAPDTGAVLASKKEKRESIDSQIPNDKANVGYASTGKMTYVLENSFGDSQRSELTFEIPNINGVKVHTPVVDEIMVTADNDKYVQAVNTDKTKIQLVVGRSDSYGSTGYENSTNDFKVYVNHIGNHISAPGYGENMDTTKYIQKVEVMADFDIMADVGSDKKEENDILLNAGTWNDLSQYQYFYVPEWVKEGDYKLTTRTLALNASTSNNGDVEKVNIDPSKYIAYSEKNVQISGKMYGLTLTGVNSSASDWKNVFALSSKYKSIYPSKYLDGTFTTKFDKKLRYYYTSGTSNELGLPQTVKMNNVLTQRKEIFTYPILNGASPIQKGSGMLKSGYIWNFSINTIGRASASEGANLRVIPDFYWISEDLKTREKVDIYYSDRINGKIYNNIKIGSVLDRIHTFSNYAASPSMGIPANEIVFVDKLRGSSDVTTENVVVYTYSGIELDRHLKTYTNDTYASLMKNKGATFSENQLKQLKQTWYFQYSLPNQWYAVPEGYDLVEYVKKNGSCTYRESFFKQNGYLVVHFSIGLYDKDGKLVITYKSADSDLANMWQLENQMLRRTDAEGNVWSCFDYGDVIVLRVGNKGSDDYRTDHLN